jgi:hypothetical protein
MLLSFHQILVGLFQSILVFLLLRKPERKSGDETGTNKITIGPVWDYGKAKISTRVWRP